MFLRELFHFSIWDDYFSSINLIFPWTGISVRLSIYNISVFWTCAWDVVHQFLELRRDIRLLPSLVVQNQAATKHNHNSLTYPICMYSNIRIIKMIVSIQIHRERSINLQNQTIILQMTVRSSFTWVLFFSPHEICSQTLMPANFINNFYNQ